MNAEVTKLKPGELAAAMSHVLAGRQVRCASAGQVRAFLEHLRATSAECVAWGLGTGEDWTGVCAAVVLPGRTALLLPAEPGARGLTKAGCFSAAVQAMAELSSQPLHYVQSLCELDADALREMMDGLGFSKLTQLSYLERDPRYPWVPPPESEDVEWIAFTEQRTAQFAELIQETYGDSLDCPALNGLRPMGDVLAAHQAAGRFDPDLWQIARVSGSDSGALLIAVLGEGRLAEISYMGVHPAARGKGVGRLLVRRALALCRDRRVQRVTLVVDEMNEPAKALYTSMGFRLITRRIAYCKVLATARNDFSVPMACE